LAILPVQPVEQVPAACISQSMEHSVVIFDHNTEPFGYLIYATQRLPVKPRGAMQTNHRGAPQQKLPNRCIARRAALPRPDPLGWRHLAHIQLSAINARIKGLLPGVSRASQVEPHATAGSEKRYLLCFFCRPAIKARGSSSRYKGFRSAVGCPVDRVVASCRGRSLALPSRRPDIWARWFGSIGDHRSCRRDGTLSGPRSGRATELLSNHARLQRQYQAFRARHACAGKTRCSRTFSPTRLKHG